MSLKTRITIKTNSAILIFGLAVSYITADSVTQAEAPEVDYALQIERGRNIVKPLTRRGSGVAIAVGVDGTLVWSEGFGNTDREKQNPVSARHRFRLYSLMKQVTAVLALDAVVAGEIRLDTSARQLLPQLPAQFDTVTLLQLLSHTSGIRHYLHPAEAAFFQRCGSARDALALFVNDPLVHPPGQQETYSTYGFILASAMLEVASGLDFPTLVQERLAVPANIGTLKLESRGDTDTGITFYNVDADGRTNLALPVNNSCKMGGGGFLASAEDLVRFHNAALDETYVPETALRQLLGARSMLLASGSGEGGEAVSLVDLDRRISVVVLSNTSGLEQRIALERARDLLYEVFSL